jgi:hypothetical protein
MGFRICDLGRASRDCDGRFFSIVQPKTNWIADIVQAEFPGISASPGKAPTQIAKPETGMHTVTAK